MSDVLAGMSRKEALEWVDAARETNAGALIGTQPWETLLALAALGARCVGAKEWHEDRWKCPECGIGVAVDEDGCCSGCGRDCEERAVRVLVLEGE